MSLQTSKYNVFQENNTAVNDAGGAFDPEPGMKDQCRGTYRIGQEDPGLK